MNKAGLIDAAQQAAGLSKLQADDAVSAVFEQITNALARGESVQLLGFGSFHVKQRAARQGKNPQTGQAIHIPAKTHVTFKAGKKVRTLIEQ
ncbi:DNA-binding protein HU-beta [Alteromonadaceae bacterium Bs31]|nr:DNA-binding protein HU-beta [Alteromonadaceae bacterium Bs31]